jgi:Glucan phosphorylase
MKVKVSNSNAPVWRDMTVKSRLPEELSCLEELAKNLWWVWNSEATELFAEINPVIWKQSGGNPVLLLEMISYERMEEIVQDKEFMKKVDKVCSEFKAYMDEKPDEKRASVAYFSMEYGLANCLKIYSGGLGVLAGDYLKEASDSNVRLTAVGFLYRYGYFTQTLSIDGNQEANYEAQNFNHLPLEQVLDENGRAILLEVPFHDRIVIQISGR